MVAECHDDKGIDPAWEYFVPDPEIDEIVHGASRGASPLDRVVEFEEGVGTKSRPSGLRFGHGNPDGGFFKLAPARSERLSKSGRSGIRCLRCSMLFFPERDAQKYCSADCWSPLAGSLLTTEERADRRRKARRATVAARWRRRKARRRLPELWRAGLTVAQIAAELSVNAATVLRWRERCGEVRRTVKGGSANVAAPCEHCGVRFEAPLFRRQRFCSPSCARHAPRAKAERTCVGCGSAVAHNGRSKYCSAECSRAGRSLRISESLRALPKAAPTERDVRFAALWVAGEKTAAIAAALGIDRRNIDKVRKRLGLPPRDRRLTNGGRNRRVASDQ